MANVQARNILVGAGDLYVTDSFAVPGEPNVTPPEWETVDMAGGFGGVLDDLADDAESGWHYVGATQEGVELAYTPDYGEVEVDQLKGAALLFNTAVSVTASTTLAEASLLNLIIAWGVPDEALSEIDNATSPGTRFDIGMPGDDPAERSLAIVGKGNPVNTSTDPEDPNWQPTERVYYAHRVISAEGATLALRRTEPTTYGVTFRLLPYGDAEGSEFGVIVDRIVAADTP